MASIRHGYNSQILTGEPYPNKASLGRKLANVINFGKCKCIHIGHGNMDEEYKMGGAVLGRTTQEKDLGVTFSADMKISEQCGIAASKGNQILGLIRRTIMCKEKQLMVPLYKAMVRPILEYCI